MCGFKISFSSVCMKIWPNRQTELNIFLAIYCYSEKFIENVCRKFNVINQKDYYVVWNEKNVPVQLGAVEEIDRSNKSLKFPKTKLGSKTQELQS